LLIFPNHLNKKNDYELNLNVKNLESLPENCKNNSCIDRFVRRSYTDCNNNEICGSKNCLNKGICESKKNLSLLIKR